MPKVCYFWQGFCYIGLNRIKMLYKIIFFLYVSFLTYILLRPTSDLPRNFPSFEGMDKVVHFLIFALLTYLYRMAFPKHSIVRELLLLSAYALLTEIMQEQMQMGRTGDPLDMLADVLGILTGMFAFNLTKKTAKKK